MLQPDKVELAVLQHNLPPELQHQLLTIEHPEFIVTFAATDTADAVLAHAAGLAPRPPADARLILFGTADELAAVESSAHVAGIVAWPTDDAAISRALATYARWLRRERRLRELAYGDMLTGLLNRRGFEEQADRSIARARRDGAESAVLVIDLDHFKSLNDTYGHAAGDAVLRHVGALIRQQVRPGDVVGRLGGEEFAIILPAAPLDVANATAERLRAAMEDAVITFDGQGLRATASVGVASTGLATHHAPALRAADKALYRAKSLGRNCVQEAPRPPFWTATTRAGDPSDRRPRCTEPRRLPARGRTMPCV